MYGIQETTFDSKGEIVSIQPLELPLLSFSDAHRIVRILSEAKYLLVNEGFLCVEYIVAEIKPNGT